jgi:hypothetical protein
LKQLHHLVFISGIAAETVGIKAPRSQLINQPCELITITPSHTYGVAIFGETLTNRRANCIACAHNQGDW